MQKINYQQILDILKSEDPMIRLYLGILLGISFMVLLRFISYLRKARKPKGIYLKGERGDLLIHQSAISDFVTKSLTGRVKASILKVIVYTKKNNHYLTINVSVPSGSNVQETVKNIHDIVFTEATEKLGLDNLAKVHVVVKDFKTKERVLEKKSQKLIENIEAVPEKLDSV